MSNECFINLHFANNFANLFTLHENKYKKTELIKPKNKSKIVHIDAFVKNVFITTLFALYKPLNGSESVKIIIIIIWIFAVYEQSQKMI